MSILDRLDEETQIGIKEIVKSRADYEEKRRRDIEVYQYNVKELFNHINELNNISFALYAPNSDSFWKTNYTVSVFRKQASWLQPADIVVLRWGGWFDSHQISISKAFQSSKMYLSCSGYHRRYFGDDFEADSMAAAADWLVRGFSRLKAAAAT